MTKQQDVDNRRMRLQQSIDEGKLKIDFSDVKREIDKITSEYKPKKVTANRNRKVLAIDPGPEQSALVIWDGTFIISSKILPNLELLYRLDKYPYLPPLPLVIEQVVSLGMPVGATTFETVFWTGRFCQVWGGKWHRMPRRDVKMHLCNSMRAKDSNIRQALIDRFGAPGTKKAPGLTYGLKKDMWAAFALAVTWYDKNT